MLGKTVYTLPLSKFDKDVSIELISKLIYDTAERIKWDKTLKVYNKVHEDENFFVTQAWIFSPIVLVSERDHIDKRISFSNDGKFYHFCSAIPDGVMSIFKIFRSFQKKIKLSGSKFLLILTQFQEMKRIYISLLSHKLISK